MKEATLINVVDRWTDSFLWPALAGAWLGVCVSSCAAVVGLWIKPLVIPTAVALGTLAVLMFVLALLDPKTRKAVNAFNIEEKERSRKWSWSERFFSKDYGDMRLLIINQLAWLEMIVLIFSGLGHDIISVICFESFALSTLMVMLMMKRRNDNGGNGS
ncbi:hypothetical protein [Novosphingobium sp.]|uniref:hypothetical protein n=1 Tax=Novosphingobium sp. TaxID=1874826 RepID=UPI0025DA0215|nr:hypothetical protein [Novosphingobium sp.]